MSFSRLDRPDLRVRMLSIAKVTALLKIGKASAAAASKLSAPKFTIG